MQMAQTTSKPEPAPLRNMIRSWCLTASSSSVQRFLPILSVVLRNTIPRCWTGYRIYNTGHVLPVNGRLISSYMTGRSVLTSAQPAAVYLIFQCSKKFQGSAEHITRDVSYLLMSQKETTLPGGPWLSGTAGAPKRLSHKYTLSAEFFPPQT